MAFRKKDVKKASYYVWFLGAKESEGLRGEEFVLPVLRYLLDRESQLETSKVTLQVSNKGLKIIQNVPKKGQKFFNGSNLITKMEQIKHLIPHHAITCVVQEEDIICCILLIYNPITKCPVHVHSYRCDSIETATSLRLQLQILIDRPDNQRKFREIEKRLVSKGLVSINHLSEVSLPKCSPFQMNLSSDGRSTRTESSDHTEDSFDSLNQGKNFKANSNSERIVPQSPKAAMLYESLAAELKAKLSNPKSGPILLPPRDYDTISRKQGKLKGIETRKSTNAQIVRPAINDRNSNIRHLQVPTKPNSESSGKSSSGIGSDELVPLSPETARRYEDKYVDLSSEEEPNWSPIKIEKQWGEPRKMFKQCHIPPPIIPKTRAKTESKAESKFESFKKSDIPKKQEVLKKSETSKNLNTSKSKSSKFEASKPEPSKFKFLKCESSKSESSKMESQRTKNDSPPQPKRYYFPDSNFIETEKSKSSPVKSINLNYERPKSKIKLNSETHSINHSKSLVRIGHWPSPITY